MNLAIDFRILGTIAMGLDSWKIRRCEARSYDSGFDLAFDSRILEP